MTPFQIALNHVPPMWLDCYICGHDYQQSPNNIVNNGDGCPYCAKTNKKLCIDEESMRRLVGDMIRLATNFDGSDKCGQVMRMDAELYQEILSNAFKARYNL
jgi:hypothetical protein